jgi:hypothetical protein
LWCLARNASSLHILAERPRYGAVLRAIFSPLSLADPGRYSL